MLVALVPTRNRCSLAIRAVQSILDQAADVRVLVSDNSTVTQDAEQLQAFCRGTGVDYIVPPDPLPMTQHWEFALSRARQLAGAGHVTVLTDRMVFVKGALAELLRITSEQPAQVITYNRNRIDDLLVPAILDEIVWSGALVKLSSRVLLALMAKMSAHPSLPRMLNCCVPTAVLDRLQARFGAVFSSISPDFAFCFRTLATEESICYYDKPLLVEYGMAVTNGGHTARGVQSDEAKLCVSIYGAELLDRAPLPGVLTVGNAIVHEYLRVREETGGQELPDIDLNRYLMLILHEVRRYSDSRKRLATYGEILQRFPLRGSVLAAYVLGRGRAGELKRRALGLLSSQQPAAAAPLRSYSSLDEALEAARSVQHRHTSSLAHLSTLQPTVLSASQRA